MMMSSPDSQAAAGAAAAAGEDGVVHTGWLWKSGVGWAASWRRRWFELRADASLAYSRGPGAKRKGVIHCAGCRCTMDATSGSARQPGRAGPVLRLAPQLFRRR